MVFQMLYFLVEGNEDEDFILRVLQQSLSKQDCFIKTWRYANKPLKKTKDFIKSINSMKGTCFYLRDLDLEPCVLKRKNTAKRKLCGKNDCCNIVIVVKEIESWYLGGLESEICRRLKIRSIPPRTDDITKEQFNGYIPRRKTKLEFMYEILENFNLSQGIRKNESLSYFVEKLANMGFQIP